MSRFYWDSSALGWQVWFVVGRVRWQSVLGTVRLSRLGHGADQRRGLVESKGVGLGLNRGALYAQFERARYKGAILGRLPAWKL